jgi:histone H3/H4
MEKRTTVILDKNVYDALVKESLEEYQTSKAISKVLNEILKRALMNKAKFSTLVNSKKIKTITAKEFEKFRSELSSGV